MVNPFHSPVIKLFNSICPVNLIWVVRLELTTNLVPKTSRLPIAAHPYKEYCSVFRMLYQTELHSASFLGGSSTTGLPA